MKKTIVSIAFTLIHLTCFAQAPDYYNDVNLNFTGQDLLNELASKITNTHTNFLSYTPGVWDACKAADVNPSNNSEVILIYGYNDNDNDITNDRTRGINDNGGNTDDWNREHVFPKSLGNPNLGTSGPGADAHHLRPSDVTKNSTRGSRKFSDGSGNASTTSDGYWYPGDEWKGDVARMMMYMYLRYDTRCLPSAVGVGNTLSNDSNMIDLFLEWNVEDPVSSFEQQRNEAIANIQGNRNPFIDNPAFATYIWGGTQAEDLFGSEGPTDGSSASLLISEYVEGSSFNKAIEIANLTSSSVNLSSYSLKIQTNGTGSWSSGLSLSGTLNSGNVYVIASAYGSSTLTDLADQTSTSNVMTFNGNDAVGLFYNDTLIDIVGIYNGDSSNYFGYNDTLVRDTNASPSTTYNSSEWTVYNTDTFDYLGSFDGSSTGGGSTTVSATLNITFDNYSSETSWEILNSSNTKVYSGSGYSSYSNGSTISINMDLLSSDCYTLIFYDSYGDGICCSYGDGYFALTSNGSTLASGDSFGTTDSSNFCISSAAKTIANNYSINDTNTLAFTLYPNPTSDYLYIAGAEIKNASYIIYNLAGAEIKNGTMDHKKIDVSNLVIGQYIITIDNGLKIYNKYFAKK